MVQAHNFVSVDVPKTFKEVFREIMSADPLVVDLHKLGPYYYEFARHLMKLTVTEGQSSIDTYIFISAYRIVFTFAGEAIGDICYE